MLSACTKNVKKYYIKNAKTKSSKMKYSREYSIQIM